MQAYQTEKLLAEYENAGMLYLEFLRTNSMSLGIYKLEAGAVDPQTPHDEDEVYYVISGKGKVRVGEEDRKVKPGSIIFVAKQVPHQFHSIEEDLAILVMFAPAESK